DHADARWGVAARGALVEAGAPEFHFPLSDKASLWAEDAARLYAAAVAAQWDPDVAVDWQAAFDLPDEVEDAVVQVMSYLVENENAALLVPARFLGQMHPHYREVLQCLAITLADEARHVEVFTRRIALKGRSPARSTAGAQASLKTLFDAPDFAVSSLLLAVLGEGSFVHLLNFLQAWAPDPVTRQICRLAGRDEARHVAFGMSHLTWQLAVDPGLRTHLSAAVDARYDALADTDGLNEEVFDALVLLAAGAFTPEAVAAGHARVQQLMADMAEGRRARLAKLGFGAEAAAALAQRHTRNFM
ncbi:MAG: ferritin-like domain-containing protein, partial [Burkholderiales bacterium]|nr:ferritin-like domain-containing protein [Burkholderiales bacterium]